MISCGVCGANLKSTYEQETEICVDCVIDTHGCSTGDCDHISGTQCQDTLRAINEEMLEKREMTK